MIWNTLEKHRDAGLLILRLGVGFSYMYFHGWSKITGGPESWARYGGSMEHLGITFLPTFWGFMVAFTEFFGGFFIAIGFLFRPAAALIMIAMIVATNMHIQTGQGGPAHSLKMAFVFAGLFFIGPGKYSLDSLIYRKRNTTTLGLR
jgi:putative oxidoreductase